MPAEAKEGGVAVGAGQSAIKSTRQALWLGRGKAMRGGQLDPVPEFLIVGGGQQSGATFPVDQHEQCVRRFQRFEGLPASEPGERTNAPCCLDEGAEGRSWSGAESTQRIDTDERGYIHGLVRVFCIG